MNNNVGEQQSKSAIMKTIEVLPQLSAEELLPILVATYPEKQWFIDDEWGLSFTHEGDNYNNPFAGIPDYIEVNPITEYGLAYMDACALYSTNRHIIEGDTVDQAQSGHLPSNARTLIEPTKDLTIADNLELAYEYYFSVCDSLSVSAMPVAQFEEQWKARRRKPAEQAPQPSAKFEAEVWVSMLCSAGQMVVDIRSGGRDLSVRTVNGTSAELRSIAKEMEDDGLRRLRRAALIFAGANELERTSQARNVT